jgi:hypothetical protein
VFASKIRVGVLGLMVMLLVGSYAATAYAEPGPFCHQRLNSEAAENKITEAAPEQVQGEGGEQKLESGTVALTTPGVQVKGIIYNNEDQCQAKLELKYHEVTWVGHTCTVTVGTNNTVKVYGHLAWKWDGTKGQLEEQPQKNQVPDWIFLPSELKTQEGFKGELPKQIFTTITFKGGTGAKECASFGPNITVNVTGSVGGVILKPEGNGLEKWARTEEVQTPGVQMKQHIWDGFEKKFVGVDTGLAFNGSEAKLTGNFKINADLEEIAHFEK